MNTKYFQHENGRIAYDERGEGPLVICSPSLGDVRAEYRFLAPRLAESGFRVVTMDLRGHGESSVEWPDYSEVAIGRDLLALIRHLDAGPALIVGASKSGGAAVWAAAEDPELVAGLILINPFVRSPMPAWQAKLMFTPLFSGPWGPWVWVKYYQSLYPTAQPEDFSEYLTRLKANLKQPGRMKALLRTMLAPAGESQKRLERVSSPAMVIMGSRDPDFKDPAAEGQWIAEQMDGEFRLVEDAGHYPHAEMPDKTADLVVPFAQKVHQREAHVA